MWWDVVCVQFCPFCITKAADVLALSQNTANVMAITVVLEVTSRGRTQEPVPTSSGWKRTLISERHQTKVFSLLIQNVQVRIPA